MKVFFRVFAWFLGILVTLFLLGQIFLMIRQSESRDQQVHRNSETIVRVNVDKLLVGMAKNAVFNPREYFVEDSLKREDRIPLWQAGVSIPANLYFFTTSTDSSAFYAVLKLKDKAQFHRYLHQYIDREVEMKDDGLWYIGGEDDRLCFVGDEQYALMAVALKKYDRRSAMHSILFSDDLVMVKSLDIPSISESKSDLTYWNRSSENAWRFDFSNGQMDLAGEWTSSDWILFDKPEARTMDRDNLLSVWLHADIRPALVRHRDFFAQYHVDIDSIQSFIGNYWEVQWKPYTVLQQDTIVTYDYDDNFEIVEQEAVRDTPVPDIRFSVKASPHLLSYLPDRLFYQFGKRATQGLIHLSTDDIVSDKGLESVDHHFYLRYTSNLEINMLTEYFSWLDLVREAEFKGHKQDSHRMQVTGLVTFKKQYIHPLKQLLDRL